MTTSADKWASPQPVDAVTAAFPARVNGSLLPLRAEIPTEFKDIDNPWARLVSQWFFKGLTGRFVAKDGIDLASALRHLSTCMASFEPKHEDKTAGVAYLMSRWFNKYEEAKS